ncbi:serine/threonine protein kinase [Saccharomonospora sp. CUA-673]|uniref:Stk1 family PASTA domain-containing Ser/Thr kinase n=1 Tax=Saccharomonospora sp. CUA-673 TaxID=1904969 RepID=UPI00095E1E1C|nr:Stk1 family PASTA domain-containing Ser/Thr kinase [Saccharomonospora sp. CUA-673]OLT40602.1 serine/threonine protein kinase [Saccharomonospora sp. CUA-673]
MSAPRMLSNRYELGDTLGYGGMSEVHHAHDVRLGREVAVKILRADLARDPQFQERFRREAQNAAALNHPAIVAVYDTGEADTEYGPLPYIVMEYVEGRTLRDIVKTEGPMPERRAMEVMADVSAALDFSHRHGIVHRDVKPANVMITRGGAVKVMDFGIARAVHDGQAAMTQTAAVIGTAQYLSPEQARGEKVDARSDVYAAGCVLYELVTGDPPFTGDSPVAVAYQHVREDPKPPSASNPEVSPELDAVVLKALAKGADNRYQSAAEMRSDLVRTLTGQRPSAPMVMSDEERTQVMGASAGDGDEDVTPYDEYEDEDRKRRRKPWLIALLVLLGLGLIALVAWLMGAFSSEDDGLQPMPSNLVGMQVQEAKRTLNEAGFNNINEERITCRAGADPSDDSTCTPDQIGKVTWTDPQGAEQVNPAEQVTLRVGAEPEQVQVPDLRGMSQSEAEEALRETDLQLDQDVQETEVSDESAVGTVVAQDPGSDQQVERGTSVSITVGIEPATIAVENMQGKQFQEAKQRLEELGFTVARENVDSDQQRGIVVNQTPNAGEFERGHTIQLQVSNGANQEIQMPDLTGMTEGEAKQALRQAGWEGGEPNVQYEEADEQYAGRVTNTNPSAGQTIPKNRPVTIYVGSEEQGSPPTSPTDTSEEDDDGIPGFP